MAFSSGPDFDKEMKMLEGVTKTVVSKSTLALVLSEHTTVLRGQVKVCADFLAELVSRPRFVVTQLHWLNRMD